VALRRIDDPAVHLYLARDSGEPVSTVMTIDVDGDCGVYCAATLKPARGRGLGSRLMSAVLLEARRRGCTTASLQASSMGYPIYRKLGFRDLGETALWELRRA
jgi:GNAT superfamily N-acetyltransferase